MKRLLLISVIAFAALTLFAASASAAVAIVEPPQDNAGNDIADPPPAPPADDGDTPDEALPTDPAGEEAQTGVTPGTDSSSSSSSSSSCSGSSCSEPECTTDCGTDPPCEADCNGVPPCTIDCVEEPPVCVADCNVDPCAGGCIPDDNFPELPDDLPVEFVDAPSTVAGGAGANVARRGNLPFTGIGDFLAPMLLGILGLAGGFMIMRWARYRDDAEEVLPQFRAEKPAEYETGYNAALKQVTHNAA